MLDRNKHKEATEESGPKRHQPGPVLQITWFHEAVLSALNDLFH